MCQERFHEPEEHHEGLADVPEVVVPFDGRVGVERDVAKHLGSITLTFLRL